MSRLGLAIFVVLTLVAKPVAAKGEIRPELDLAFISEHVVRGVERAGAGTQVEAKAVGGPWRARLRSTAPFERDEPAEWVVAAGWGHEAENAVGYAVEAAWVKFGPGADELAHDTLELRASAEWVLPRETRLRGSLIHDVELEATTAEIGLEHGFALARWGTYLDCRLFAGWSDGRNWRHHTGRRLRDAYGYWGITADIPYRVAGHTSVVAGAEYSGLWNYTAASNFAGPKGRRNLVVRVGVRFDF